jgi:hypothetical protein
MEYLSMPTAKQKLQLDVTFVCFEYFFEVKLLIFLFK